MDYFAGLDVSVKDTSVCIVDETGKIVREVKVASEPDAPQSLLRQLARPQCHAPTTRSNTLRKMPLSRNRSLRARENAE
jgi:hypothetical protein